MSETLTEIVDIREYCKLAAVTESSTNKPQLFRFRHATDGFTTETGEMVDVLKKHEQYGKPVDETNLLEELGDIMWYWALGCNALNLDPAVVLARNIEKLKTRYGDKFSAHAALNRDLEKERQALEGTTHAGT